MIGVQAQEPTDKTSSVAAWTGGNYTSAQDQVALKENYVTNTTTTGNIFEQTVSGLDQGYYKLTLYANAIYTPERGFTSDASDFDSDRVFIFATGNGVTKKTAVPIKYGIITTGSEAYTVNAYVGTDGNLTIGLAKDKVGTNWHTIATKSLYFYGNDLTIIKAELNDEISTAEGLSVASSEEATLNAAIDAARDVYNSGSATFDEVDAAITTLKIAEKYALGGFSAATLETPVLTTFVVNGDFTSFTNDWPNGGWFTTAGVGNHGQMTEGSEKAWENYSWGGEKLSGKMYFRMNDVPNGAYSVSIDGFSRTATSTYVYANKERVYLTSNETYETKVIPVIVKNNILEIGEYSGKIDWMKIKKVSVSYTGDPLASYKNTIASLIETGESLDMTGIPASISGAVTDAIDTYKPVYSSYTEEDQCTAAIADLQAAIQGAQAYINAKGAVDKMNTILENTNVYTAEAYNTFTAYITKFNNAEYTNEEANTLSGTVFGTGWRTTAAVDDFLISAWDANPRDWSTYHINTWSTTGDSGNPNFVTPCFEYWGGDNATLADKLMTATLGGFTPGATYKVAATVCVGVNTTLDPSTAAPTGVTLQLNDGSAVSVCTGDRIAETRFYEGTFEANATVGLDGNLVVKLNVASTNASWITWRDVKYTKTGDAPIADASDYAALQDAIDAFDGAAWGFETGEYAPYNNVRAIENIAAAKAIDKNVENPKLLVNSLTTALALSANAEEVNAFYGGDFTQYETISGEDMPYGWNLYNGADNHSRIMGGTEGSSNAGLAATSSHKALLLKLNATYGESAGYTMPLKAGKLYKITFKQGRWNEANPRVTDVVMTDPNGASITLAPGFKAEKDHCETTVENWETYTGYFVSTTAGNYKFNLTKQGGNTQMQIAIGDIELKSSTDALVFADDAAMPTYAPGTYPSVKITRTLTANKWATAVYPFAVSGVDNIAVLDSYSSATGEVSFTDASESVANVPFMMMSESDATEISLSDVAVSATAANPTSVSNQMTMKGVYDIGTVPQSDKNQTRYAVVANELRKVSGATVNIKPFRAYFEIATGSGEAREFITLDFDGATAINAIEAANAETEEGLKDGKYLIDNKIVIVKNGVKYGANGQKLN